MGDRTIHIRACVFGGRHVVVVEPRTVDRPSIECRTLDQARTAAAVLSKKMGWPVVDETGEHVDG